MRISAAPSTSDRRATGRKTRLMPDGFGDRWRWSCWHFAARAEMRPLCRENSSAGPEDVADAAHGVDHTRAMGLELRPQIGHVALDEVHVVRIGPPEPAEQLGLRHHAARLANQRGEDVELEPGQLDAGPGPHDNV